MNAADKILAEAALRQLCVGAHVDDIRSGAVPQLLLIHAASDKPIQGQICLNLESTWRVFPERPDTFPAGEETMETPEAAEALRQLWELRGAEIRHAELAAEAPDLILTFADGRVFFLNGRHERYESWQLGGEFAPGASFQVVACPGNEVAVWTPPGAGWPSARTEE
jgi:PAS domain-containing protein